MSLSGRRPALAAALLLPGLLWAHPLHAQLASGGPAWNDARVLELIDRARETRRSPVVDSALVDYQARADGYVYFFMDRPDSEEHVLVKADQIALDLYWRAPDQTKQRIVGQRDEKVLPTSIRYHLDHLTVVQDDFGDYIRLGDGDEVGAVVHPAGPGSDAVYDFALVDSLTLAYGRGAEVRVYQVRVRPRDFSRPGLVGTVFLDRATAAIVRMNFSFTPASYVDSSLDYIRVSLDNSLWMGRFWLPYRQEFEIRREMPMLDFSTGSVIRTRFTIGDYEFNADIPEQAFNGGRVSALPLSQRRAFAFEQGLFEQIDEEGLTVSTTMEEVRTQVREVVEDEVMSGLSPIRFHLDGVSDFARYDRAEGVFLGAGLTLRPVGELAVRPTAGYAIGRRAGSATVTMSLEGGVVVPTLAGYWDRLTDFGGNPGATLLVNTISAASGSKDFLDPYFARGGSLSLAFGRLEPLLLTLRAEEHVSATDVVSDGPDTEFRPVRSVHEGTYVAAELARSFALPAGGRARLSSSAGRLGDRTFGGGTGEVDFPVGSPREGPHGRITVKGGAVTNDAPAQAMFLLGGRHTLQGQDYRAFVGNAYWLARAEATIPVRRPWFGVRLFGSVGATHLGPVDLPADWLRTTSDGLRGSVGLGLSVAWDAAFIDVAHGVRGGGWEAVFSVSERFAGWM